MEQENRNMLQYEQAGYDARAQPRQEEVNAEAAQEIDSATRMRAQLLVNQAQTILQITGVDVMKLYETDVEVRQRVLSGEWDFVDVWKHIDAQPKAPSLVRSANGSVGGIHIGGMNSRQFEKLNEMLSRGGKVNLQ